MVGRLRGGEQQQTMIPSWDRAAHLKRERERMMVQSSLLSGGSVGLEQLRAQCPTPRVQDNSQESVPRTVNKHEAVADVLLRKVAAAAAHDNVFYPARDIRYAQDPRETECPRSPSKCCSD